MLGMVTELSSTQPLNAVKPIALVSFGMTVFMQPAIRVPLLVSMMALHPSAELYFSLPSSTMMLSRLVQSVKGFNVITVTDLGITTAASFLQLQNASSPIYSMELGSSISVSEVQFANVPSLMIETEFGIETKAKDEQFWKAA